MSLNNQNPLFLKLKELLKFKRSLKYLTKTKPLFLNPLRVFMGG
ncbi:hypothetical protein HMPREF1396_00020 [Helicobacter pylori GAM114Ai]|nr:hypothetical protein HMPREF1396_00020 [Helicobacter pylori GAM114Ai]